MMIRQSDGAHVAHESGETRSVALRGVEKRIVTIQPRSSNHDSDCVDTRVLQEAMARN